MLSPPVYREGIEALRCERLPPKLLVGERPVSSSILALSPVIYRCLRTYTKMLVGVCGGRITAD